MRGEESARAELEAALERLGRGGRWLRTLFLLGCWPGVLNAMHLASYVFLAAKPEHWCKVPELARTDWSPQQLRNISSDGNQDTRYQMCQCYENCMQTAVLFL